MIELEDVDGTAVVRIDHGRVGALDLELCLALADTFDGLDTSHHRAVVLTGSGSCLSAGVDLRRVQADGERYLRAFLPALARAVEAVLTLGKPVVAALDGHAVGGGLVLACAADQRVAAPGVLVGLPELVVGVPFPLVALECVSYALGPSPLLRGALLTGTVGRLDAPPWSALCPCDTADDPVALALQVAGELCAVPADAFRHTKRQLQRPHLQRVRDAALADDAAALGTWLRRLDDGALGRALARTSGGRHPVRRDAHRPAPAADGPARRGAAP